MVASQWRSLTGSKWCIAWQFAAALLLLSSAWSQQPQSPADREARIDRLISQLDDDQFQVREKAEAELAAIGEAALAKLVAALKDSAPERRERAEKLVKRIREGSTGLRLVTSIQRDDLLNGNSAAVSPDGKFLYIASFGAGAASVFRFEPATSTLEHVQSKDDAQNFVGVMALRLSPDGKLAAATCGSGRCLVLMSRDPARGTLTEADVLRSERAGPRPLSAQSDAAFSPDGKHLYSLDRSGAVIVFEITAGPKLKHVETFTGDGSCFTTAAGLAVNPDGSEILVAAPDSAALCVLKRDAKTGRLALQQVLRDEQDGIHGFARVYGVCYSPDCRFAYTYSDRDHAVTALRFDENRKLHVMQEFLND
jgi:WD40 repeat protein